MQRFLIAMIVGLIFFHLVGQELPIISRLPGNLVAYAHLMCLVVLPLFLVLGHLRPLSKPLRSLLLFFSGCAIVFFVKLLAEGDISKEAFLIATRYLFPFELGILVMLGYSWALSQGIGAQFVKELVWAVTAASLMQFALAIPEARGASINQRHSGMENLDREDLLDARDVMASAGTSSQLQRLGIVRPMTGGFSWFNEYGVMVALVLANLLVLHRDRLPVGFMPIYALFLLAEIAATTKTTQLTVVAIGAVYFAVRRARFQKIMFVGIVLAIGVGGYLAFEHIFFQRGGETTLWLRFSKWQDYLVFVRHDMLTEPLRFLFGIPTAFINGDFAGINFTYGSCENELLYLLIYFGFVPMVAYVALMIHLSQTAWRRLPRQFQLLALFPIILVLTCGATMDCLHKYFALPLFTLLLLQLDLLQNEVSPQAGGPATEMPGDLMHTPLPIRFHR